MAMFERLLVNIKTIDRLRAEKKQEAKEYQDEIDVLSKENLQVAEILSSSPTPVYDPTGQYEAAAEKVADGLDDAVETVMGDALDEMVPDEGDVTITMDDLAEEFVPEN